VSEGVHEKPLIDAPVAKRIDESAADDVSREERARRSGYRRRFAVIYVGLALVLGLGIGALVVVASDSDDSTQVIAPAWSDYQPNGSTNARAEQIAQHVSERYRLGNGEQLVGAIASPPIVVSNQPEGSTQVLIRAVAVRPDLPVGGEIADREIEIVDTSNSVQYALCGYGQGCSIASGQPSPERHLLLRREALELALYTFKYMNRVNSVVIFLPPPPGGETASTVVFFRRRDLGPELSRPLSDTLSAKTPGVGGISAGETATLNRITARRTYQYDYTQSQDGGAILLLDPVTTAP
jgi:hypothetical protein